MENPFAYPMCSQTVTVYRLSQDQVYRRVQPGCYYRWRDYVSQDDQGDRLVRNFLLIQPGENPIYPGDRIFDGEGPILTVQDWEGFLPVRVPGLSETAYAQPWYWQDKLCHWEAGRK